MTGLGPFAAARLPYTTLVALSFGAAALRAQRLMEQRWEQLVETYPERLEDLEVAFGRHLHERYPQVRSAHTKTRLVYERSDAGRLVMELGEPLRTPLGWGGLRLDAWHGETALPLPVSELLLTLLRGGEPEWMARTGGWLVHRLTIVDAAFIEDVSRRAFG